MKKHIAPIETSANLNIAWNPEKKEAKPLIVCYIVIAYVTL